MVAVATGQMRGLWQTSVASNGFPGEGVRKEVPLCLTRESASRAGQVSISFVDRLQFFEPRIGVSEVIGFDPHAVQNR